MTKRQQKLKSVIDMIRISADEMCPYSGEECRDCEKDCYYDMLSEGRISIFGHGVFSREDNMSKCECTEEDREYVKNMLEKLCKGDEINDSKGR